MWHITCKGQAGHVFPSRNSRRFQSTYSKSRGKTRTQSENRSFRTKRKNRSRVHRTKKMYARSDHSVKVQPTLGEQGRKRENTQRSYTRSRPSTGSTPNSALALGPTPALTAWRLPPDPIGARPNVEFPNRTAYLVQNTLNPTEPREPLRDKRNWLSEGWEGRVISIMRRA